MSPSAQQVFSKCVPCYRDTILPPHVLELYQVGILFREPTFCDATHKFGGFAAPHRYLIVSANAKCIDSISKRPEWGMCMWKCGSIFKVIGIHNSSQFAQITLLEIPEEFRREFTTQHLSEMEVFFANQAQQEFELAQKSPILPEHQTRDWLDRLVLPVGVGSDGKFLEFWRHGA